MSIRALLTIETGCDIARSVVEYLGYAAGIISIIVFGIAVGWLS